MMAGITRQTFDTTRATAAQTRLGLIQADMMVQTVSGVTTVTGVSISTLPLAQQAAARAALKDYANAQESSTVDVAFSQLRQSGDLSPR